MNSSKNIEASDSLRHHNKKLYIFVFTDVPVLLSGYIGRVDQQIGVSCLRLINLIFTYIIMFLELHLEGSDNSDLYRLIKCTRKKIGEKSENFLIQSKRNVNNA